jgi:hypothetical protein
LSQEDGPKDAQVVFFERTKEGNKAHVLRLGRKVSTQKINLTPSGDSSSTKRSDCFRSRDVYRRRHKRTRASP